MVQQNYLFFLPSFIIQKCDPFKCPANVRVITMFRCFVIVENSSVSCDHDICQIYTTGTNSYYCKNVLITGKNWDLGWNPFSAIIFSGWSWATPPSSALVSVLYIHSKCPISCQYILKWEQKSYYCTIRGFKILEPSYNSQPVPKCISMMNYCQWPIH